MNVLLREIQRYIVGMQIILLAFHLKIIVVFDKDYLYCMNGLLLAFFYQLALASLTFLLIYQHI